MPSCLVIPMGNINETTKVDELLKPELGRNMRLDYDFSIVYHYDSGMRSAY